MERENLGINRNMDWISSQRNGPFIVAGPCSAESEMQVMKTAEGMAGIEDVKVFRAGIWKPRTRPQKFEGVGEKALSWVSKAGSSFGFKTAVEVSTPKQASAAIDAGIDWLWIGARTVANPFSVKELVGSLPDIDIPVLVKNPPYPDVHLWRGAVDRLHESGKTHLGVIFRGYYNSDNSWYRNSPDWSHMEKLEQVFSGYPLLCDPSHIAGRQELVGEVAMMALIMGFRGLMIEVHSNPEEALTDAHQQLTPAQLKELLEMVGNKPDQNADIKLSQLRREVKSIDHQLLELINLRFLSTDQIGRIKRGVGMDLFQPKHWKESMIVRLKLAEELGLDRELIRGLWETIHKESIRRQKKLE